jgi:hypothetical protein
MTLFFNLKTLEQDTKGDSEYLVEALYKFYRGITIPKNIHEKYKPLSRLKTGSSFLLQPESFFKNTGTDSVYKAQYIRLAGLRNYGLYKTYGIKSLDLTLYPDISINNIKSNPLLIIANKQIKFIHEEI